MTSRRSATPGRERGAAAVELALVLPLLMTLLLGTIDWGYYFYVREIVTNAAREGARAGTLYPLSAAEGVVKTSAEGATRVYVERAGLAWPGGTPVTATVATDSVSVTIRYPVGASGSITGFLSAFLPDSATATAVMRR